MADANEVYMDIPEVQKIAKSFNDFGQKLDEIAKVLEVMSAGMKATSWLSFGATAAVAAFIDMILPTLKNAANIMRDISRDVLSAIQAYQTGDTTGSRRFC